MWAVFRNFTDSHPPHGHNMYVQASFRLAGDVPLTVARLDSALLTAQISVFENAGYAPVKAAYSPAHAWVRRDGDHIRLHVEDESAISDILRAQDDKAGVTWCQRDAPHGIAVVPIEQH
jgi:hypothetical protein